jgi:hypothetical protein
VGAVPAHPRWPGPRRAWCGRIEMLLPHGLSGNKDGRGASRVGGLHSAGLLLPRETHMNRSKRRTDGRRRVRPALEVWWCRGPPVMDGWRPSQWFLEQKFGADWKLSTRTANLLVSSMGKLIISSFPGSSVCDSQHFLSSYFGCRKLYYEPSNMAWTHYSKG